MAEQEENPFNNGGYIGVDPQYQTDPVVLRMEPLSPEQLRGEEDAPESAPEPNPEESEDKSPFDDSNDSDDSSTEQPVVPGSGISVPGL